MRAFQFGQPVQENLKGYSLEYQLLQRLGESEVPKYTLVELVSSSTMGEFKYN